jgi:hypothetical protein
MDEDLAVVVKHQGVQVQISSKNIEVVIFVIRSCEEKSMQIRDGIRVCSVDRENQVTWPQSQQSRRRPASHRTNEHSRAGVLNQDTQVFAVLERSLSMSRRNSSAHDTDSRRHDQTCHHQSRKPPLHVLPPR